MAKFQSQALNLEYTKAKQAEKKNSNALYIDQRSSKDAPIHFKVLPPIAEHNNSFFVEACIWWLNKKQYIALDGVNELSEGGVIGKAFDKALASKDETLRALATFGYNTTNKNVSKQERFFIPVYIIDEYDENNKVKRGSNQLLCVSVAVWKNITDILTNDKTLKMNGGKGHLHLERGSSFELTQVKNGDKVEYSLVSIAPMDISEVAEPVVVKEKLKSLLFSDEYLEAVAKNYLYGESLPSVDKWLNLEAVEDDKEEAPAPVKKASKPAVIEEEEDFVPTKKASKPVVEDDEEEAPAPVKKSKASSLSMDDLED